MASLEGNGDLVSEEDMLVGWAGCCSLFSVSVSIFDTDTDTHTHTPGFYTDPTHTKLPSFPLATYTRNIYKHKLEKKTYRYVLGVKDVAEG